MDAQLLTELLLIGSTLLLIAVIGYFLFRHSNLSASQKQEKMLTGFLGAFLLMGGTVKFFDPFTTMFANQIALSGLPFPTLSRWVGQLGEISVGVTLLTLLLVGKKLPAVLTDRIFYLSNLVITVIMLVAVYVHLHPNVPAEVLPLGSKPPGLTLFIMVLAWLNVYLHHRNQRLVTQPGNI